MSPRRIALSGAAIGLVAGLFSFGPVTSDEELVSEVIKLMVSVGIWAWLARLICSRLKLFSPTAPRVERS